MSTPSPFIFTKNGLSYRVELDVHYISDEEMQMLRRYITTLNDENEKLRELVARLIRHIEDPPCESCMSEMSCAGGEGLTNCDEYQFMVCDAHELGVDA